MTNAITGNWNPETYTRFRGLRLRPALDLIAQIGELPAGGIADLGCGNGAVAAPLRAAFPGRHLTGVDTSAEMLAAAKGYDATILANIAGWQPKEPPALLFSNAALQWLPDHSRLMPQLAALLAPGGVLAVQMPGQSLAPSHRLLRETAMALFPDRFDFSTYRPPVGTAESYWHMLAPLGEISAWETSYMQKLGPAAKWHPVSAFTESTAMLPFLQKLATDEAIVFRNAYDKALQSAYPPLPDGSALMPFRRVFFILRIAG